MTGSRAPDEPYTLSFEATVDAIDGREVVLDTTYFYPEGGGQPPDRGTIGGVPVGGVREPGDAVVHALEEVPDFEPGDVVTGHVDPAFRTYCRRAHTASHVLYGAGRRLLDDLGYGGFDIDEGKVRVDFSTPTGIDDATLVELERLVNRTVWDSREVSWETLPQDEALAMDDVAFNTKTEEGIAGESVRIVTVDDWDVAACGGTHVENTREIGPVSVLERSNPGEGLTRVEFAVGPSGIDRRATEKRALLDAARTAAAPPSELADEVGRLRDEVDRLEVAVTDLEARLARSQLENLREEVFERNGASWLAGAVDDVDADALGDRAKELAGDAAEVVALAGEDGRTFVVVAADGPDASGIVERLTDEFGGGGGGSPEFAQGGGIDADPEDVVSFLRE